MNPPPKKPFIGKILPGNIFFPDPYPKYTEDVTILNTTPKFGDLCSLFQQPDNTEIHNQPDSEIPVQKLDLEAIERWEKEVEKAQQKKDSALKEYDECKKLMEIEDA